MNKTRLTIDDKATITDTVLLITSVEARAKSAMGRLALFAITQNPSIQTDPDYIEGKKALEETLSTIEDLTEEDIDKMFKQEVETNGRK
jgi:hypothetical protein